MDMRLETLSVVMNGKALLRGLSLELSEGKVAGLIGPNGSGKSTALRCIYRALKPSHGAVWVGGEELTRMSLRRSAQIIGALTQDASSDLDFTVEEVVAMGRAPHLKGNQALSSVDRERCSRAMEEVDIAHLAHRGMLGLSGGERQRVMIARALAQEPRILVLDEPTNHLDLHHQLRLLSLLRRAGRTVLVVLHDLNLAAACCDRIAVLREGCLAGVGTPEEVLTADLLRSVFGVDAMVVRHPLSGVPQVLYALSQSSEELRN